MFNTSYSHIICKHRSCVFNIFYQSPCQALNRAKFLNKELNMTASHCLSVNYNEIHIQGIKKSWSIVERRSVDIPKIGAKMCKHCKKTYFQNEGSCLRCPWLHPPQQHYVLNQSQHDHVVHCSQWHICNQAHIQVIQLKKSILYQFKQNKATKRKCSQKYI